MCYVVNSSRTDYRLDACDDHVRAEQHRERRIDHARSVIGFQACAAQRRCITDLIVVGEVVGLRSVLGNVVTTSTEVALIDHADQISIS